MAVPTRRTTMYHRVRAAVYDGEIRLGEMASSALANALVMLLNRMEGSDNCSCCTDTPPDKVEVVVTKVPGQDLTLRQLQDEHREWLKHNFLQQAEGVSADFVKELCPSCDDRGRVHSDDVAGVVNKGWLMNHQPYALLGLMEELGELSHSYIKMWRGIRKANREGLEDAVGDIVIFLTSFCNTHGIDIDLQDAVERAWAVVKQRDWVEFPGNGVDC